MTVRPEDLLGRPAIPVDRDAILAAVAGRRVLVTGAGGSIGSELCRSIAVSDPQSLWMVDRNENGLHETALSIADGAARPILADLTDDRGIERLFARARPDLVFHAAAYKHVPLAEAQPSEAVRNNVGGTRRVATMALRYGTRRFVLVSTDKAVNPSSVMGATKRAAELIVRELDLAGGTRFASVRFGNVLGSSGSVLPRFLDQIAAGRALTVTHPDVSRFVMLVSEAAELLIRTSAFALSGDVYMLKMGEPIRIVDLARAVLARTGVELPIEYIGLRPGEKLREELIGAEERAVPTGIEHISRIVTRSPIPDGLFERIDALELLASIGDERSLLAQLWDLVRVSGMERSIVAPADDAGPQARATVMSQELAGEEGLEPSIA